MTQSSSSPQVVRRLPNFYRVLRNWAIRHKIARLLFIILVGLILIAGSETYRLLQQATSQETLQSHFVPLIYFDLLLVFLLLGMVSRRLIVLWLERRSERAGSKIHVRLVIIFGLLGIVPSAIMSGFAILAFHNSLDAWFTSKNRQVLRESLAVATAYLEEHKKVIRADAELVAQVLANQSVELFNHPEELQDFLNEQIEMHSLSEGLIFDQHLRVIARSRFAFTLEYEKIAAQDIQDANLSPVVRTSEHQDRLRALVSLPAASTLYLYVGRVVDTQVLKYLAHTHGAVAEYNDLEARRGKMNTIFALIFITVALLVIVSAVWGGLVFADLLMSPIRHLISAAEKVKLGDLSVRVPVELAQNELSLLSRTFNRMTRQLAWQRDELVRTNQESLERQQFLENVLSGVSSGVIQLNEFNNISLYNKAAAQILDLALDTSIGQAVTAIVPEFNEALKSAQLDAVNTMAIERQIAHHSHTLLVRVTTHRQEINESSSISRIITFDDISALLAAQRKAAWSDIARRIAHEIKNPLTPIQLAAQRLQRKYGQVLSQNTDAQQGAIFDECIHTIIRQVNQIGRLVDEFSAFARMPQAQMRIESIDHVVQTCLSLQQLAHPQMQFTLDILTPLEKLSFDSGLMSQAMTNLLLNAVQAIEMKLENMPLYIGMISINIRQIDEITVIKIHDNGIGLPDENRDRLTEPYVTTKAKGTGLGLAIVKNIMAEHNGTLALTNNLDGGACITLTLPKTISPLNSNIPY